MILKEFLLTWRSLVRGWPLTIVVVGSLGAAIGAHATIFGIFYSIFERSLPFVRPAELVSVQAVNKGLAASWTYTEFREIRRISGISSIAAYRPVPATISIGNDHDENLQWIDAVSGDYFQTLGVRAWAGRELNANDEVSAAHVVVVSEQYWREHLGEDRGVIGRMVTINDKAFTIVGVMPPTFSGLFFAHRSDFAVPVTTNFDPGIGDVSDLHVKIVARLPLGSKRESAAAELQHAFDACCLGDFTAAAAPMRTARMLRMAGPVPDDPPITNIGSHVDTLTARPHIALLDASRGLRWGPDLRSRYHRATLVIALGAALLVLIAFANVAVVFATQSTSRRREFAVRLALGASRRDLARQVLIQAGQLAVLGVATGLLLAEVITGYLVKNLPPGSEGLAQAIKFKPDSARFAYAAVLCAMCTFACASWPIRMATSPRIVGGLQSGRGSPNISRTVGIASLLVVLQIASSMVLIVGALLFAATLRTLGRLDGGYGTRNVTLARVSFDSSGVGAYRWTQVQTQLIEQISHLPGVQDIGLANAAPLLHDARLELPMTALQAGLSPREELVEVNAISPGFLRAAGIRVERGREFERTDNAQSSAVALVSHALLRHFGFGDLAPWRLMIGVNGTMQPVRVVGVVGDAQYWDIHNVPTALVYLPRAQAARFEANSILPTAVVAVRGTVDPAILAQYLRRQAAGAGLRVTRMTTAGALLDEALARERLAAFLGAVFGIVALGLVGLGSYGVISYHVAQRTNEIGVRAALGAQNRTIAVMFLKRTLVMVVAGLLIGLPCVLIVVRVLASSIYGVSPYSPGVLVLAALGLVTVALLATLTPLRRALRVDPAIALRSD